MPQSKNDIRLAQKRILRLKGDVTKKRIDFLIEKLLYLNLQNNNEIKLLIDSGGGSVGQGLKFYDYLQSSNASVTGIVIGACDSTAIAILQGCHKRIATRHSIFFCHSIQLTSKLSLLDDTEKYFSRQLKEERQLSQGKYINILAKKTGQKRTTIEALMRDGDQFNIECSSEKALALGFIDEIVDSYDLFS